MNKVNFEHLLTKVEKRESRFKRGLILFFGLFIVGSAGWLVFVSSKVEKLNMEHAALEQNIGILTDSNTALIDAHDFLLSQNLQVKKQINKLEYELDYLVEEHNIVRDNAFKAEEADSYIVQGRQLARKGRWEEAIAKYSKAIEIYSSNPIAWEYRGYAYLRTGDYESARESMEEVLRQKPGYWRGHYNMALVYWGLGDVDNTILEMRKVLQADESYAKHFGTDSQFKDIVKNTQVKAAFPKLVIKY